MRKLDLAALLTVPFALGIVACLATERDRGQALADGSRYVRTGCEEYLRNPAIPRHPEADESCPVIAPQDVARSVAAPPVPPSPVDSGTSGSGGSTLHTSQGNALRSVQ